MHVTEHSIDRFLERVNPRATRDEAEAIMLDAEQAVEQTAAFGCYVVRLGCGAKLVLRGTNVVTVLGRGQICASHIPVRA